MIIPCISAKKRHGTVFPHYIHTQIDLVVVEDDECPGIPDQLLATFPIRFTEASESISVQIKEGELKQIYRLHHCSDASAQQDTSAQQSIILPCQYGAKVKIVASPVPGVQLPGFVFWFHVVSNYVYTAHEAECVLC